MFSKIQNFENFGAYFFRKIMARRRKLAQSGRIDVTLVARRYLSKLSKLDGFRHCEAE
jgi:hypothetical protein